MSADYDVTMTVEQARIVLLEQELRHTANTISFLHGCLTDKTYKYAYPEHTVQRLEAIKALVEEDLYCFHSMTVEDCLSCQQRIRQQILKYNAQIVLALEIIEEKSLAKGQGLTFSKDNLGIEVSFREGRWHYYAYKQGNNRHLYEFRGVCDTEAVAIARACNDIRLSAQEIN